LHVNLQQDQRTHNLPTAEEIAVIIPLRMGCIMHWIIEIWYYGQKEVVRVTGHKTPGESLVNITVCNYDTTHLQENPQRLG